MNNSWPIAGLELFGRLVLSLFKIPLRMILERTPQRERNSELIRSRTSPDATATLNGRVFDQLGAVRLSFKIRSTISGGTGVERKSRVLLREAKN
jgi:hypothetical protein